jgi:putative membrane protein insertion efficiency factor
MIWLVRLYQKYISPLKRPCCRFTPTCSSYAIEAFQKRGFFVGMILTVWRILRCNPFSKGGYDPVPERGFRNRNKSSNGEQTTDTNNEEKEKEKS